MHIKQREVRRRSGTARATRSGRSHREIANSSMDNAMRPFTRAKSPLSGRRTMNPEFISPQAPPSCGPKTNPGSAGKAERLTRWSKLRSATLSVSNTSMRVNWVSVSACSLAKVPAAHVSAAQLGVPHAGSAACSTVGEGQSFFS